EGGVDLDELLGLLEVERLQERRVDHAEDRRVRADAEREREDRDGREAGTAQEPARREAKIEQQRLHGATPTGSGERALRPRSPTMRPSKRWTVRSARSA